MMIYMMIKQTLSMVALQYSNETTQLLCLLLQRFPDGFENQKGAIFGFCDKKDDNTDTATKICKLSNEELKSLTIVCKQTTLVKKGWIGL